MESYDPTTSDYNYDTPPTDYPTELCGPCEVSSGQEETIKVIQTTIFLIVFCLGITGNGLVIATFMLYRRLRLRCMTDVFLFYLALSDMLLLLTLPLQTSETLKSSWDFGETLCRLNRGMYAINTYSGLLLLACISVDRYLVVVRTRAVRKMNSKMMCYSTLSALGVALASVTLSLPDLCFSSVNSYPGSHTLVCEIRVWGEQATKWTEWARGAKIAGFCIPCVAMMVCYSEIGRVLLRAGGKCWRRQRTLRLMVLLVVLFLLFQSPYTVVVLLRILTKPENCDEWTRIQMEEKVTCSLAYVRCCLNPLLYALVGVRFRNDIVRLLTDAGCGCLSHLKRQHDNGSCITPSSPAPTSLSFQPSATPTARAANSPQTFIFPSPISAKKNAVVISDQIFCK